MFFSGFLEDFYCIRYNRKMASSVDPLTPFNYHQWKGDMEIQLCAKGLYRVTMDTEIMPNHVVDKARYWNKMDESFGFLCLSISKDLHFHVTRLKNPNEIWHKLSDLFNKQDDMRIYLLENELIYLHGKQF